MEGGERFLGSRERNDAVRREARCSPPRRRREPRGSGRPLCAQRQRLGRGGAPRSAVSRRPLAGVTSASAFSKSAGNTCGGPLRLSAVPPWTRNFPPDTKLALRHEAGPPTRSWPSDTKLALRHVHSAACGAGAGGRGGAGASTEPSCSAERARAKLAADRTCRARAAAHVSGAPPRMKTGPLSAECSLGSP